MPKTKKSPREWRKRLHEFARGVDFKRGERPRKDSTWAKELEKIEKCPKRGGAVATTDLFGNPIVCVCGYHLDDLPGPSGASSQVGQAGGAYASTTSTEDEMLDSHGIPGWDKVDQLADALLNIRGFSMSNRDAEKIKSLYEKLIDYDKQSLMFHMRQVQPSRGRFGRTNRSGHVTLDVIRRCFLPTSLPACSPSKSRVVEALCVKLCDSITQPRRERHNGQRPRYTSRWKLILEEYNCIRARLSNSAALMEGTSLALFPINETTLTRWYKNTTRMNEVKLLLRSLPDGQLFCTSPPAQDQPCSPPPPPENLVVFSDPEDTTGQAHVRSSRSSTITITVANTITTAAITTTTTAAATTVATSSATPMSRTTEWRHRKKLEAAAAASTTTTPTTTSLTIATSKPSITVANTITPAATITVATSSATPMSRTTEWRRRKKLEAAAASTTTTTTSLTTATSIPRKVYTCRLCGQAMNKQTGHSQFKGKRYCPNEPGQVSQEEWLQQQKAQAAAARASQGQ